MLPSRRQFLAAAGLVPVAVSAQTHPNILVFMTDQESALLPGSLKTPARDRLRAQSTRFNFAFCNTPQCSAARAALLTGLYPHLAGVRTNVDGSSLGNELPKDLPNVGSVFSKAGYATGYFGKWHLSKKGAGPTDYGFGFAPKEGSDEAAAEGAASWITKQKGPWLAWVSVLNPHDIYHIDRDLASVKIRPGVKAPHSDLKNLKDKPAEQQQYVDKDQGKITSAYTPEDWLRYRSYYLQLLEMADSCLAAVLSKVDMSNTIIVYTTDHGDALGEHGLPFKGPFQYEELARIPLWISAPGRLKPGGRDDFVMQIDLAPTLADLAKVEWPAKQSGVSLLKPTGRREVYLEYFAKQKWANPFQTVRTRRYKLNRYESGSRELYDLEKDPHELVNLAGSGPLQKVEAELSGKLDKWWKPQPHN